MRPAEGRSRVSGRKMQPACGMVGRGLGPQGVPACCLLPPSSAAASRRRGLRKRMSCDERRPWWRCSARRLETLAYEECWAVYLTSSNRIIERQRISQGGVQGTVVDHRLVVKRALELLATQLVLIHNHPSGAAAPSPQDKVLTERVAQAAALFDIRLLDHIIIAREGDFSFLRAGLV